MQTRRINEATIGLLAIGKIAELGRQLVLSTDSKYAEKQANGLGKKVKPETLQVWANGYIAFDAIISVMGVLAIIQGARKNRKGAGRAALIQGGTTVGYSVYYLLYSIIALRGAKFSAVLVNLVISIAHGVGGVVVYRFAQRALK